MTELQRQIEPTFYKNEPRIDSRVISNELGVSHKATIQLINEHEGSLKQLGLFPFQMEKVKTGRPLRYALLNEDQAYFLLTLSKNTDRAVQLKLNLVRAFSKARNYQKLDKDYLPFYHDLHDVVKLVAEHAKIGGSQTSEKIFHINFNKLINQMLGISSRERESLSNGQKLFLTTLYAIAHQTIREKLEIGIGHRQIYKEVKEKLMLHSCALKQTLLSASDA